MDKMEHFFVFHGLGNVVLMVGAEASFASS